MNPCVTHKIAQINLGPFDGLYFHLRSSQRFPDSNFFSNLVNVFRYFKILKKKGGGVGRGGLEQYIGMFPDVIFYDPLL